jgi:hypothetical protein
MTDSVTYEPIMNGILALLQGALMPGTFRHMARGIIMLEQLDQLITQNMPLPFRQPALFLFDGIGLGGGKTIYHRSGRGMPAKRTLLRTIVIYAQLPGAGTPSGLDGTVQSGGTVFAPLIEAVEAALEPPPGDPAITLGGLVSHVWTEGESHWVTGEIFPNGQGMCSIPLNIVIP